MKTITVYSGSSCAPCVVAKKRLGAAGIPFEEVVLDLPENAEVLAGLKRRLERDKIPTPLIQFGTHFAQIDELSQIMADYQAQSS